MRRILSLTLALSMLLTGGALTAFAEDTPAPADVDEAVYAQLLQNKWSCDQNEDGIITDEELQAATQLSIDLDGITDLSWLAKLEACKSLSFRNGTLTDFSVLSQLPALRSLNMSRVPITDVSFMKALSLESAWFYQMDQITPAQRMEVMRFEDPAFWEGTAGEIMGYPRGFVDYTLSIADTATAVFVDGSDTSIYAAERIYGVSSGKTAYTVSLDGKDYYTGEITVEPHPAAYDPALHGTEITNFKAAPSSYYDTDPETGNSGNVALVNGTLYTLRGSKVEAVETDVADLSYYYARTYSGSYNYADIVQKTDGTLLLNGEAFLDTPVRAVQDGYVLTESGAVYAIVPKGDGFVPVLCVLDAKDWIEGCSPLYLTEDGHLKYFGAKLVGDGVVSTYDADTGIGVPLSTCKVGSSCYVVDASHTLYQLDFSTTITQEKLTDDAVSVRLTDDHNRLEYVKTDGTVETLREFASSSGYAERARKNLGIGAGTFYIHEYQSRGVEEDDAVFDYFIGRDGTMSLSFLGSYCGLTHVEDAVCATYDTEQANGYVYFLRTDGSIWGYDLDTKQWQEAAPGTDDPHPEMLWGDVNADGTFDVRDLVLYRKWLLAVPDAVLTYPRAGDLDADGTLDVFDLSLMQRALLRLEYAAEGTVTAG